MAVVQEYFSPLTAAAVYAHEDVVKALLEAHANVNFNGSEKVRHCWRGDRLVTSQALRCTVRARSLKL